MIEYKTNIPKFSLVKEASNFKKVKIKNSEDAAEYARQFYGSDIHIMESFFIILLNNSHNTIGYVKISQGGITGTLVDVRIVAKYAIEALAVRIICVHNHPSGSLKASAADLSLTKKLQQGLKTLDIEVLDHIIIIPDSMEYISMADDKLI